MTKKVKYFVKYKKRRGAEQPRRAPSLPLPSDPIKAAVSPHQHRHKSQRTICLSSSSTPRLMLRPVETNLPKANISSSETWRGVLKAFSTHQKALSLCPSSVSLSEVWELKSRPDPFLWFEVIGWRQKQCENLQPWVCVIEWEKSSSRMIHNLLFHFGPLISIFSRAPWAVFAESDTKVRLADRGQHWQDVTSLNVSM